MILNDISNFLVEDESLKTRTETDVEMDRNPNVTTPKYLAGVPSKLVNFGLSPLAGAMYGAAAGPAGIAIGGLAGLAAGTLTHYLSKPKGYTVDNFRNIATYTGEK